LAAACRSELAGRARHGDDERYKCHLQQGSWYYRLEVAQRPFVVWCISVADAAFVTPGLITDGRVGFIVRCEPAVPMKLVITGAPDVTDTIDIGGDGDRDRC